MNTAKHPDGFGTHTRARISGAPLKEQQPPIGPLDGLRVRDLVGFMIVEGAAVAASGSGWLLADAQRKLTHVGALLASAWAGCL